LQRPSGERNEPDTPSAALESRDVREAAQRVAADWTADADDSVSSELVDSELDRLVQLLEAKPDLALDDLGAPPHGYLRRRLLEKMRSQLIAIWSQAPDSVPPAAMLETLKSFDRAARLLDPRESASEEGHAYAANGLELLVEVAHDFRSPLTSIMYLSESLRRGQGGALSELQRRQIGIVYNAALTLISTASDVIEMASAGEHLADPEPRPFSVAETLESVHVVVQPIAEEKGIALHLVTPPEPMRLGNPVALSRVLLNLTTNALKFTDHGEVEIAVIERESDRLEFSVRDTGRGISADVLATLYQPFRRTDGRSSGYYFSGSGLGLAISRKLVRVMGSELYVETEQDVGSRFYFELLLPRAH
jgi:signal transduction histidine kinase